MVLIADDWRYCGHQVWYALGRVNPPETVRAGPSPQISACIPRPGWAIDLPTNKTEEVSVFGDDVDRVVLPEFRTLLHMWLDIRGARTMPAWREFHLDRVPPALIPWCVVVDVRRDPENFIYRFCGTQTTDLIGVELTRKSVDDIPNRSYSRRARSEYRKILERGVALFSSKRHVDADGVPSQYQTLRLPFATGDDIENILSVGVYSRLIDDTGR